ncbi:hypothetical protein Xoosp13_142 [Xanthomonas phage Xoo-sp13]|nr:hypothetical protein Xoosp13_142 [Xanthomonas phage Xoo-sp13]
MEYTYHYPAQEWQWGEDDVSINVVNNPINNAIDNGISIYINERLVSKFIMDRHWSPKSLWEKELRVVEGVSVHTVLLEFIDKWGIGV